LNHPSESRGKSSDHERNPSCLTVKDGKHAHNRRADSAYDRPDGRRDDVDGRAYRRHEHTRCLNELSRSCAGHQRHASAKPPDDRRE